MDGLFGNVPPACVAAEFLGTLFFQFFGGACSSNSVANGWCLFERPKTFRSLILERRLTQCWRVEKLMSSVWVGVVLTNVWSSPVSQVCQWPRWAMACASPSSCIPRLGTLPPPD